MRTIMMPAIVVAGATAIALAAPAGADPTDGPCGFTPIPICAFVPELPNLDHDVDLTKDPHALDGATGGDLAPNTADGAG